MGMSIRNEIIERLENLAKHAVHSAGEPPLVMSLDDGIALHEAIELLKAQEPRLITEADFENADEYGFIPVWCEVIGNTKDYWNCITKGALETAKEDGCRYWTTKPSLKQMEETPWE